MPNQSIQRASKILALFSYSRPYLKVSQVAQELGLAMGTAHGLISTLEREGILKQDPKTRAYGLGMRLYELGSIHMATLEINRKASMALGYLAKDTATACRLGIIEHNSLIITLDTQPLARGSIARYVGCAHPLFCTSIGRAILSQQPKGQVEQYLRGAQLERFTPKTLTDRKKILDELSVTKERGYSLSFQEYQPNLDSIGAPIFGRDGLVCAGVSVNSEPSRISEGNMIGLARRVMETAHDISRALGFFAYNDPTAGNRNGQ